MPEFNHEFFLSTLGLIGAVIVVAALFSVQLNAAAFLRSQSFLRLVR